MENCTNCSIPSSTSHPLAGPVFGAFLILISVLDTFAIVLTITSIAALCVARSVARLVRIYLVNHLVAVLVTALMTLAIVLLSLILNFSTLHPLRWLCRVFVFGYLIGSISRLHSLAAFSVVVLLIVKYGKNTFKQVYIVLSLTFTWIVGVLLSTHILVPSFYSPQYYDGVACHSQSDNPHVIVEARYTLTVVEVLFGEILPLIVSIVFLTMALCYARNTPETVRSSYNKGISRFALFLVTGSVLNSLAHITVGIAIQFQEVATLYVSYCVTTGILFLPPILVCAFLKPVRDRIFYVLCHYCRRPQPVYMANKVVYIPLVES